MRPRKLELKIVGRLNGTFEELHAADREFLLSGICNSCFDKMFRRDES